MPELPEVEVTRRGVAAAFLNQTLQGCTVWQPKLRWPVPAALGELRAQPLMAVDRRAKYVLLRFPAVTVIVHLGMSGSLQIVGHDTPRKTHDHVEWVFETARLRLHDPRRFGSVDLLPNGPDGFIDEARHPRLGLLGPEPFGDRFDGDSLYRACRGRQVSIKAFLLSGRPVVGAGNIYAAESLFQARVSPLRTADSLTRPACHRLAAALKDVLARAIERGGSSLRDFVGTDGVLGQFHLYADVYDKAGMPCTNCATPIRRIVQGQRATFYCPKCQR
ncbi:MAG: bifunctional DNA-formamidopyrimidine glycosylase/DNA-(apurinic or apyrimidinic site) lyase [Burkholderiaceae bacterium]